MQHAHIVKSCYWTFYQVNSHSLQRKPVPSTATIQTQTHKCKNAVQVCRTASYTVIKYHLSSIMLKVPRVYTQSHKWNFPTFP